MQIWCWNKWLKKEELPWLKNNGSRWSDLQQELNEVIDELASENCKKSFEMFQKLVKVTEKSKKAIEENGYPFFFILGISDMYQQVKEKVDTQKDLRRFNNELDKFIIPF